MLFSYVLFDFVLYYYHRIIEFTHIVALVLTSLDRITQIQTVSR